MEPLLSQLFEYFLAFILLYKYQALFVLSFGAALALPLPVGTTLAASGAFASQGYLDLSSVIIVALLGSMLGDACGYFFARHYGKDFLSTIGFARMFTSPRYHDLETFMVRYSSALIFFSRFLTQVNMMVNILSGLTGVRYRRFFLFDLLGEASFVFMYTLFGYFLGSNWENNTKVLLEGGLAVISFGLIVIIVRWQIHKRQSRVVY